MALARSRWAPTALAFAALGCATLSPVVRAPPDLQEVVSDGIGHREWQFEGIDGNALFAQAWRPVGQSPRATVIVVCDLRDYGGRYAELALGLAHQGDEVRAYDPRGQGRSEGDRDVLHHFSDALADLGRFVKAAAREVPGRPVFLFGQGLGADLVLAEILGPHPPVAGVVVSGPALDLGKSWLSRTGTRIAAFFAPRSATLAWPAEARSHDPAEILALREDPLVGRGKLAARTATELWDAADGLRHRLERVTVPMLALQGSSDVLALPSGSRALVARAHARDKTLKIYEGLFHDLLREPGRAEVLSDIGAWIAARTPKF